MGRAAYIPNVSWSGYCPLSGLCRKIGSPAHVTFAGHGAPTALAKSGSVGLKNPPRRTSSGLGGSQCSRPSEQQSALVVDFQANALTTVPFGSTADEALRTALVRVGERRRREQEPVCSH